MSAPPGDPGYFGPNSLTWMINKELTVLFGGVRALLMHAAHPLVSAGARQTATYRRDPWARLLRTLSLQLVLPFGTKEEADAAADRINRLHKVINGEDPATGERYDALDPELLLWVHACLEESTVLFYELTVKPLTPHQKEQYHRENLTAAELMLLDEDRVPSTYEATVAYISETIASGRLYVTDVAREVADLIGGGPVPWHLKPIWRFIAFAAIGTLPDEIRRMYGFRFGPIRRTVLDGSLWMLKRLRPLLPGRLRLILPARIAQRRLRGEPIAMPRA